MKLKKLSNSASCIVDMKVVCDEGRKKKANGRKGCQEEKKNPNWKRGREEQKKNQNGRRGCQAEEKNQNGRRGCQEGEKRYVAKGWSLNSIIVSR